MLKSPEQKKRAGEMRRWARSSAKSSRKEEREFEGGRYTVRKWRVLPERERLMQRDSKEG